MIPRSMREWALIAFYVGVSGFILGLVGGFPMTDYTTLLVNGGLSLAGLLVLSWVWGKEKWWAVRKPVDIWMLQKQLMTISDQFTPHFPEVNRTSLLYFALMLEEMSEMTGTLSQVFTMPSRTANSIHMTFRNLQSLMKGSSMHLRDLLQSLPEGLGVVLTSSLAKALLDDSTDVAVVTAGFTLASGLPGPEGYMEVQGSNLSKANPDTGVIDKLPDGKWIKGRNYREPDLAKVLNSAWRHPERYAPAG